MADHLVLVAHSTQQGNVGDYAAYGLTEEALCRKVAHGVVAGLSGLAGVSVVCVNCHGLTANVNRPEQSAGDIARGANAIAKAYPPGTVVRLLDIHTDAGGATGTTGLYKTDAGRAWVGPIVAEVSSVSPLADHGLVKRDDLIVLYGTTMVAGLVELAPHDRPDTTRHLVEHWPDYAAAVVRGIRRSLNITPSPKEAPVTTMPTDPTKPRPGSRILDSGDGDYLRQLIEANAAKLDAIASRLDALPVASVAVPDTLTYKLEGQP